MGRAIARALISAADVLQPHLGGTLDVDQILKVEPGLAALICVLMGLIGPEAVLDKAIGALAVNARRKALLVLVARTAQEGFPKIATNVAAQLPAAVRAYLAGESPLTETALDDLGDALIVREVRSWLGAFDKSGGS